MKFRPARLHLNILGLLALPLIAGCAPVPSRGGMAASGDASSTPAAPGRALNAPSTVATTAPTMAAPVPIPSEDADEHGRTPLDARRRARLGLPEPGDSPTPAALTPQQRADPEAVGARFVVVDTNYRAGEDPLVAARKASYATPRLGEALNASSSGGARLQELRKLHAAFAGEVLDVTTSELLPSLAVVAVNARLTLTTDGQPPQRQLRFYRVSLGLDSSTGHWLVAGVEQS